MGVLGTIKADCTFNQMSYKEKLKTGPYYSFDLKAATDLMPVSLQERIVSAILSPEQARAWKHIMVGYPFDTTNGKISYATGQPMGAYSS